MKRIHSWLILVFFGAINICYTHITVYKPKEQAIPIDVGHHYLIEFTHTPADEKQRAQWVEGIKRAIDQTRKILIEKKLIAPEYKEDFLIFNTVFEKLYNKVKEVVYDVFFHTHALTYPKQINKPFLTRRNEQAGSLSVYLPDGVSPEISLDILRKELKKQGVSVIVLPDNPIHPMFELPDSGYYIGFDYPTYSSCKNGNLRKKYKNRLNEIVGSTQQRIKTYKELDELKKIEKVLALFDNIEPQLGWHQSFPTTGIIVKNSPWKHNYPFLPHQFPLWQMAPKLGSGITIAFIDTGIASFAIESVEKNNKKLASQLRKIENISTDFDYKTNNSNLVSADGLNPFDQVIELVEPYLKKPVNTADLEKQVIVWIQEYLEHQTIEQLLTYLQQQGVPEVFEKKSKRVSQTGQVVLKKLTELMQQFNLVTVTDGNKKAQKVLLECLPLAPLVDDKYKTLMIGHGSHAVGLAAGKLKDTSIINYGYEPSEQEGIYGIAPMANIVMIKAFSDTTTTHQSTMIAGLLKAIDTKAQIVNMSLKTADYMDKTTEYSRSLTTALEKIPYCVAASGNDGDPRKQGHAGPGIHVEAYPARLDGIAFDVGAFSYNHTTGMCPIPPFSQYQLSAGDSAKKEPVSIGPKFVAPGYNIISCGLVPEQKEQSAAVMMHGTSTAAPQISGFLALMLSEFGNEFTREQYLKVCYSSGIKLIDTTEWKQRSIFGALDMRTALFTLHVLRVLKKSTKLPEKYVENNFDHCVALIHELLFGMVDKSFRNDFCNFYKQAQKQTAKSITADLSNPLYHDFNKAIEHCVQEVISSINNNHSKKLLFDGLHPAAHNRVQAPLKNTSN